MKNEIYRLVMAGEVKKAAELIRSGMASAADFGGAHIFMAHVLFQAADWDEINRNLPLQTNFIVTSGLLNSIRKGRPLNANDEPVPWFTYPAIDFLDRHVSSDWTVFEWGSGNSTLWWSRHVAQVISIEDDAAWHAEVSKQAPANSSIDLKQGSDYPEAIQICAAESLDAIVIDGSQRNECAFNAVSRLKKNGIIIFDNSDSLDFEAGQQYLMAQGFYRIDFWGPVPSYLYKNCTSVFFRDPAFLAKPAGPSRHRSSVGISCFQAMKK